MKQVEICQSIYHMGSLTDPNDENSPIEVGHNIYILAVQLAHHKKELKEALERSAHKTGDPIQYYSSRTAQIEVSREGERGGGEEGGREGRRGEGTEKLLVRACANEYSVFVFTDCPQGPNSGADCVSRAPRL